MEFGMMKILALLMHLCIFSWEFSSGEITGKSELVKNGTTKSMDPGHLTPEQKHMLEKFRVKVSSILVDDYERSDAFLMGWLTAKEWNIFSADKMLKLNKEWRKDNKIEELGQAEVDAEMAKLFPYTISIKKDTSCPVFQVFVKDEWDMSAFIQSQKTPQDAITKYNKYLWQSFEKIQQELRKTYSKTRKCNAAEAQIDLLGYTETKFSDARCLGMAIQGFQIWNDEYPQLFRRVVFSNVPEGFPALMEILKKILHYNIINIIEVQK